MSCKQLKFQRLRKNGARNFWCFRWEKNWSSQKARFTHISNFMIFYKISVIPESAVCRDKSEFSNPNPDPKGLGVSGIFQLSPKPTVLKCFKTKNLFQQNLNRYWRIRSKVNASTYVFSTRRWVVIVARTRRKKAKKIACPLLDVFACGQVSSPRLYRLNLYQTRGLWCYTMLWL